MIFTIFLLAVAAMEVANVRRNGADSLLYDLKINFNAKWTPGDTISFQIPSHTVDTDAAITEVFGTITQIQQFQSASSTQVQNLFISGELQPVPTISTSIGSFTASFYNDTVVANIQFPTFQFELRGFKEDTGVPGISKTHSISKIVMEAAYYPKETADDVVYQDGPDVTPSEL